MTPGEKKTTTKLRDLDIPLPRNILLPAHKLCLADIQILLSVKIKVWFIISITCQQSELPCALQQKSFCQSSVTEEKTVMTICMVMQLLFVGCRIFDGFYLPT